ncbi:major facilitator superfamily domain-containing protein [Naematelia encephala]|uniref:Major facilitator superfamily domain-containing protein n=1 Tax=Naematelia encephala TaxID=71784 RepID=A0A1Y2AUB4_9TREE|nr:major facilitator superfamily domain-containing protein [Naematelia encephala]
MGEVETSTPENSTESTPEPTPAQSKVVDTEDYTLPRRPWRRHITPWTRIISHPYQGNGTESDPYVVDWLPAAEGDPENPMTWEYGYKWLVTICVAIATMAVAMASSTLSGATESIEQTFGVYKEQVYVMITSGFVLGFVVGPLLWAPMSEVLGRRTLFIFTYVLFTIFNGGVIASQNVWTLIILRFFAGTAGSSPLTNAGGTVSDLFSAKDRGLGMGVFASAPLLGPTIGPIIGGFLGETHGWRWVAAFIALFTAVLTVLGTVAIPETYAPVLLRSRAQLLSKATGKVYRSKFEKDKAVKLGELFNTALSRPWVLLFREPIVLLLSTYLAIVYATLYMLFGSFPIIFEQSRGWSPGISGLAFLGVLTGFLLALAYTLLIENRRYANKLATEGWLPPEERLHAGIIGGILLPIGLFAFAWTAAPARIHWIAPIICSAPFGFGMVLVFLSIFNYLIDAYLLYAASVLAANSVLRSLFGVAFPLFVPPMYRNLGINWACTLVAFLALACTPMPIIFFFKGRAVRRSSKFAREADDLGQKMRQMTLQARENGKA